MPKAKWSNTDLDKDSIENAETRAGSYAGPLPPKGVYRFKLRYMKEGESKEGNPKIVILAVLDGTWRKEHKKYDGCPLFDHLPMLQSMAWRAKALCGALGVTAADLLNKTVVDEDGVITKIGNRAIKEDMQLYISVRTDNSEGYDPKLTVNGGGYMEAPDADEADDEGDGDAEESAPPAKGGKKKAKKAAQKDDGDPF